jgi:glutaconate CoA-transferase subunit A
MSKLTTMQEAIAAHVPDGCSVAMGCQLEQMIPFAAGHEIMRQKRRDLTLIGPISDILFDQLIGAGCAKTVIAAWVGNVMMGSAYNFRRAAESSPWATYSGNPGGSDRPDGFRVFNMTNFTLSLALQAAAMGVPFLPTRTARGSDVAKGNHFFYEIVSPFANESGERETLYAVRALAPDVTIVHVQRADEAGNAHCWGNFGVMLEAVRAARKVIVCAEEIVSREVVASDPNRTVIPGFLVHAVVESKWGAHPSPVQGCYSRDNAFFEQYHLETKTPEAFASWRGRWVDGVADRAGYVGLLGEDRVAALRVKRHAYAAPADYGY